jgi:hypothetical protein
VTYYGTVPNLHLERTNFREAHLERAILRGAQAEDANVFLVRCMRELRWRERFLILRC